MNVRHSWTAAVLGMLVVMNGSELPRRRIEVRGGIKREFSNEQNLNRIVVSSKNSVSQVYKNENQDSLDTNGKIPRT